MGTSEASQSSSESGGPYFEYRITHAQFLRGEELEDLEKVLNATFGKLDYFTKKLQSNMRISEYRITFFKDPEILAPESLITTTEKFEFLTPVVPLDTPLRKW